MKSACRSSSSPPSRPESLPNVSSDKILPDQQQFRSSTVTLESSTKSVSPGAATVESPLETETVFETPGVSPSPSMVSALENPFGDPLGSLGLSVEHVGTPLSAMSGSRVCKKNNKFWLIFGGFLDFIRFLLCFHRFDASARDFA